MTKPALVALRDRREEVIRVLSDAYANDLVEVAEFEARLERAHAATDVATLDGLVTDLADLAPSTALTVRAEVAIAPAAPLRKRVRALFSNVERRGIWTVPNELGVTAIFGNAELDLREAKLSPGTTELRVRAVFGNLEIIVPPELAVECDGTAIFANFEHHGQSTVADPDRPMVRIVGSAVFGNVEVKVRLRGDDAPKQLGAKAQLALPPKKTDG